MTLLLDTQALFWWRESASQLGPNARVAIGSSVSWISVATIWEASIKHATGRLELPQPPDESLSQVALQAQGFRVLSILAAHAIAAAALPRHHQDPFDRMLIAQAQLEHLTIVTSDAAFEKYEVTVLDARR